MLNELTLLLGGGQLAEMGFLSRVAGLRHVRGAQTSEKSSESYGLVWASGQDVSWRFPLGGGGVAGRDDQLGGDSESSPRIHWWENIDRPAVSQIDLKEGKGGYGHVCPRTSGWRWQGCVWLDPVMSSNQNKEIHFSKLLNLKLKPRTAVLASLFSDTSCCFYTCTMHLGDHALWLVQKIWLRFRPDQ